jgi:hypothetical protein
VGRVDEELVECWVGGERGGEVGDVVDDGVVLFEEDGPVRERRMNARRRRGGKSQ